MTRTRIRSEPSLRFCQISGTGEESTEGMGQSASHAVAVLNGSELVRVDVERDAGTSVPHLPTDGGHVRALPDEVRAERVR